MATTNIGLTTTFTPPNDCLSGITEYQSYLYLGYESSCRPSSPGNLYSFTFSPAWICPSGWTSVAGTTVTAGSNTETRAVCCPPLTGVTGDFVGDTAMYVYDYGYDDGCTAAVSGPVTASVLSGNGSSPLTTMSYNTSDYGTMYGFSVEIAWQASDLVASKTASITSSGTSSTSSSASPTSPTATPAESNSSSGLSTGAKIAIGVVIPVVVLAALALAFCIFVRKRKTRKQARTHEIQQEFIQGAPVSQMEMTPHNKYPSPQVNYAQLRPEHHDQYDGSQRWSQTDNTYVNRSPNFSNQTSPNMRSGR